jgi:Rrf2 family nitric oxide-sensitive transcriptional repressor
LDYPFQAGSWPGFSDTGYHARRVLLFSRRVAGQDCSISELARACGISQNHLMKVVHDFGQAGYVVSTRGRFGGVQLALPADGLHESKDPK